MLMVVFGAGASYDSVPHRPSSSSDMIKYSDRLPLANELFGDRNHFAEALSQFPRCLPVVPYLRHLASGSTVEHVLEQFQAEATEYPERHRQLASIRYYLHLMLWQCEHRWEGEARGVTNFKTLLDQIERWRKPSQKVCLVTFNYDTLIEKALPTVGVNIREIGDYIASEFYKFVKLHGSVNWAREVNTQIDNLANMNTWQVAYELINRVPGLDISQKYCIAHEYPIGKSGSQQVLFPALAIPVETKRDYECPAEHLQVVQECVEKVSRLLLIGWRATEEPFLRLLRENLPMDQLRVMVVAGGWKEANETIQRIRRAGIKADEFLPASAGFSDFIINREGEDFLKT
jgi:hypothetical protein